MEFIVFVGLAAFCVWVWRDAKARTDAHGRVGWAVPGAWAALSFALWIVFGVWYLAIRGNYPKHAAIAHGTQRPQAQAAPKAQDVATELREFSRLRDEGLISELDYEQQRARLLGTDL